MSPARCVIFIVLLMSLSFGATVAGQKDKKTLPDFRVDEWAEWVITISGPKTTLMKQTEGTREHLLDVQAPKTFRIRFTVLGKAENEIQFRTQVYHNGQNYSSILPADPRTLLDALEIDHGSSRVTAKEPFAMQVGGQRLTGTVTIIEHTPEGGSSYIIKQWRVPQITLGPIRLEYPGGMLELKAWGLKEQPDFPMPESKKGPDMEGETTKKKSPTTNGKPQ